MFVLFYPLGNGYYGCLARYIVLAALNVLWLLSWVALTKVAISKLFRMERAKLASASLIFRGR